MDDEMSYETTSTSISPHGLLDILSKVEVARLLDTSKGGLYELFRNCSLAVLNSGGDLDDGKQLLERYRTFDVRVRPKERGITIDLFNAPIGAFVDGEMIQGIREQLLSVVRDLLYANHELSQFDLNSRGGTTDAVFHMLRNAGVLEPRNDPNLIVCWGGHSISRGEYDYTKDVGYQLGLRGLDICTGCGPGAMKGPMKGGTIGHSKQRIRHGRYLGITEPEIIAAEAPNPIVNNLVIMPDIEKRLEAFVRSAHGIVVFPGGVGTMEEILYILGVLQHPDNQELPFPLVFSGPDSAVGYFEQIDEFIGATLGEAAKRRYRIIIDDAAAVAREMVRGLSAVKEFRDDVDDAYYFNWLLRIERDFQERFTPNHGSMRDLDLTREQPMHKLAANLRRAFSGIVAGNVKDAGIRAVEQHGVFEIKGDPTVMSPVDRLLQAFGEQRRMKLSVETYRPCYRILD